jgi:TolB-like protein/DNA-binding winged helix-turn-helix (wHTH) protein/Tfp pilus assembly protein PilF
MDSPAEAIIWRFDDFLLDVRLGVLFRVDAPRAPTPISLGSRAFEILRILVERRGALVSKQEIMDAVWPNVAVEENNLTVQISTLRRALDVDRAQGSCIQTVSGRGYRFIPTVTLLEAADAPGAEAPAITAEQPVPRLISEAAAWRRRVFGRGAGAILLLGIGLVAVGWIAAPIGGYRWFGKNEARPRLSIVVLPFANLGNDPEQEYLTDAIGYDLTTDLSRIAGSVVIAQSTANTYRDKSVDVKRIGHDLGVNYVLEGSVRRMGDQVQMNVQLIDATSGTHVWAERFDTDRRNLAEAQSRITGRLARTLNLELLEAAGRRLEQEKQTDPAASDLVMRGWVLWFRPYSPAARQEAVRAFDRALEIDPRSVNGKIGAAAILAANLGLGASSAPQQDATRAERLLLEAIEQDANNTHAHEMLGMLRRIENRLDEARIEYETAVSLDRNNAHARLGLGQALMFLGRPADAIPAIESSIRLNPRDPNAAFEDWSLGTCHLLLGHANEAADLLRKARAGNPRVYFFQLYLAGALGFRGDTEEARAALTEAIRLKPEVNSMARWNATQPWITNPGFVALREKTLDVGLRRAGMPDT